MQYSAPGSACDRAHLLTTVINNIKIKSNYYQEVTLPFTIKQEGNLFSKYEELGIVKRVSRTNND